MFPNQSHMELLQIESNYRFLSKGTLYFLLDALRWDPNFIFNRHPSIAFMREQWMNDRMEELNQNLRVLFTLQCRKACIVPFYNNP